MQHLTQEPREKNDMSFRDMSDAPINTGYNQEDYEPPIPYKTGWRQQDDDERENEEERNDVFGSGYDENTERFD